MINKCKATYSELSHVLHFLFPLYYVILFFYDISMEIYRSCLLLKISGPYPVSTIWSLADLLVILTSKLYFCKNVTIAFCSQQFCPLFCLHFSVYLNITFLPYSPLLDQIVLFHLLLQTVREVCLVSDIFISQNYFKKVIKELSLSWIDSFRKSFILLIFHFNFSVFWNLWICFERYSVKIWLFHNYFSFSLDTVEKTHQLLKYNLKENSSQVISNVSARANSVSFSEDGRHVVSVYKKNVTIYDKLSGESWYRQTTGDTLVCVCIHPEGHYVAAGDRDGRILVWEGALQQDTEESDPFILHWHQSAPNDITFSADGINIYFIFLLHFFICYFSQVFFFR